MELYHRGKAVRPGSGSWGQYAGDLFAVRKRKMVPHSVDSQSLLPRVITVSMHDPTAKLVTPSSWECAKSSQCPRGGLQSAPRCPLNGRQALSQQLLKSCKHLTILWGRFSQTGWPPQPGGLEVPLGGGHKNQPHVLGPRERKIEVEAGGRLGRSKVASSAGKRKSRKGKRVLPGPQAFRCDTCPSGRAARWASGPRSRESAASRAPLRPRRAPCGESQRARRSADGLSPGDAACGVEGPEVRPGSRVQVLEAGRPVRCEPLAPQGVAPGWRAPRTGSLVTARLRPSLCAPPRRGLLSSAGCPPEAHTVRKAFLFIPEEVAAQEAAHAVPPREEGPRGRAAVQGRALLMVQGRRTGSLGLKQILGKIAIDSRNCAKQVIHIISFSSHNDHVSW
ncbi:uncharacterized protein [Manis javanica]|uniref:uncharacterized protein n=1 Tax=Manis javanica TaxID=9974 RepID=UPI003C6D4005